MDNKQNFVTVFFQTLVVIGLSKLCAIIPNCCGLMVALANRYIFNLSPYCGIYSSVVNFESVWRGAHAPFSGTKHLKCFVFASGPSYSNYLLMLKMPIKKTKPPHEEACQWLAEWEIRIYAVNYPSFYDATCITHIRAELSRKHTNPHFAGKPAVNELLMVTSNYVVNKTCRLELYS